MNTVLQGAMLGEFLEVVKAAYHDTPEQRERQDADFAAGWGAIEKIPDAVSLDPRTTTSSWLAPDVAAHQLLRALGPTLSRESRGNVRRCFSACRSDEGGEAEDYRSCPSTRKG